MSVLALKIIACVAMLVDHIGFTVGSTPLRLIGRIAFPVFLFLIYNGYTHTSNRLRYFLRLGMFAVLSQVPFALFVGKGITYYNGNVFFSLATALLCVWAADAMCKQRVLRWFCLVPPAIVFGLFHFGILHADYGAVAILMITAFWLFDGKTVLKRILLCFSVACILFYEPLLQCLLSVVRGNGFIFPVDRWDVIQVCALLALPLIFMYNGEKGALPRGKIASKCIQYGFYAFYPLHLLLLWLLRVV